MRSICKSVLVALVAVFAFSALASASAYAAKPEAVVLPAVSPATPNQYTHESGTTGSWSNGPTSLTYQWERCNATGKECASIAGATGATYTPVEADVEHTLVLNVMATNSEGSNSASSAATGKVPSAGQLTEYKLPPEAEVEGIAAGSDGNMWFTEQVPSKIGKITPSGTVTEYALPEKSEPVGIAAGPSGNLWFTDVKSSKIGKITTSGTVTEYALPKESDPQGIAVGPDGNLWFTELGTDKIGKITTSGTVTEYALPKGGGPQGIAVGPDGNLWFTEQDTSKIGKITTSGTVTEYALPEKSGPYGIAVGPEKEDLWFTDFFTKKVGKITTSGTVTEYELAGKDPAGIAAGPDGRLWVVESANIARITTSGTITEYAGGGLLGAIAEGPEANMWFGGVLKAKIWTIAP
jgi:streptogramin lyase